MIDRILIVDDEPDNSELLNCYLDEAGFEVIIANSGETALKQIAYVKPDLILLDVKMPGMDGFETCRHLKKNEATKDTPVIFLSIADNTVDKIKGFEAGAVDYITKPFQFKEVITRINKHLRLQRVQDECKMENVRLEREIAERVRAEKAFQDSEANLRVFMENARGFGVYSVKLADDQSYGTRTLFSSPSIKDILGIENPEDNASWFECIHPDDLDRVTAAHHTSRKTGQEFDETFRNYHTGKQKWTWIRTISSPVIASDGTFTHFNGLIVDVTDIKQAEKEIKYRSQIEAAVAKVSTLFISSDAVDYGTILRTIGESVSANRAYIFQIQEDGRRMSNTFEWCSAGTVPQIDMLQNIETDILDWSFDQLRNGKIIAIENVDEMPPDAATEKEIFMEQQIRSLVFVPIRLRGKSLWGFMGFDDTKKTREWKKTEIKVLQIVSEMISGDLERKIFNRLAVNRELKMVELKKEINALAKEAGQEPRYVIADL